MTTENRLIDIEIKIARQEDLVDALNQTLYQQQRKIAELEALCSALASRLKELAAIGNDQSLVDERPPHY